MKKILLSMAIMAMAAVGCTQQDRPQPLEIDNSLTEQEISAGILTPEVMW